MKFQNRAYIALIERLEDRIDLIREPLHQFTEVLLSDTDCSLSEYLDQERADCVAGTEIRVPESMLCELLRACQDATLGLELDREEAEVVE